MSKALRIHHGRFGRAAVLELDRPLVQHAHPTAHLLIKIGGADTLFQVRHEACALAADSAVFVQPWEPHAYPHGRAPERAIVLAVYLLPDWLDEYTGGTGFPGPIIALDAAARDFTHELYVLLVLGREGEPACIEPLLRRLLDRLLACATGRREREHQPGLDRRLRRAIAVIDEHYGESPDFERVASDCGLSRAHFFELFRRQMHVTPQVYLNSRRMEHAVRLVAESDTPLSSLALDLGFTAQSNFTRFFRDIQGVAPTDYRHAARAEQTLR